MNTSLQPLKRKIQCHKFMETIPSQIQRLRQTLDS